MSVFSLKLCDGNGDGNDDDGDSDDDDDDDDDEDGDDDEGGDVSCDRDNEGRLLIKAFLSSPTKETTFRSIALSMYTPLLLKT
jgi:hypothetical protein